MEEREDGGGEEERREELTSEAVGPSELTRANGAKRFPALPEQLPL